MSWRLCVATISIGFLFLCAIPFTKHHVMAQNRSVETEAQAFWNQIYYPSDWTTGTGRFGVLQGYPYPSAYMFQYQPPSIPYSVSLMYRAASSELPQYAFTSLSLPEGYGLRKSSIGTPTFISVPFGCQPMWKQTRVLDVNLLSTPLYCPVFIPSSFWLTGGSRDL